MRSLRGRLRKIRAGGREAALAVGAGGISSLRGSDVAAVGLSFTSLDSASSAFLPLAETRWTVYAATATMEPINSATASSPFFDIETR